MQVAGVEGLVQQAYSELKRWQATSEISNVLELAKAATPGINVEMSCRACSSAMQQARHAGNPLTTASAQEYPLLHTACADYLA